MLSSIELRCGLLSFPDLRRPLVTKHPEATKTFTRSDLPETKGRSTAFKHSINTRDIVQTGIDLFLIAQHRTDADSNDHQ
jgi:hypothetical protein